MLEPKGKRLAFKWQAEWGKDTTNAPGSQIVKEDVLPFELYHA